MKRRIKLTIAYDGTNYRGWQIQNPTTEHPEGNIPTIQGELTLAIQQLTKEKSQLIGASRTDSGVHAYGNVAVFDTETRIPIQNFSSAINSFLPEDIRVVGAEEVSSDFNPRFVPHIKTYEYRIDNSKISSPMTRLYSYNYTYPLNFGLMQEAANHLVGEHDFTSFVNPDSQVFEHGGDAVREIFEIQINSEISKIADNSNQVIIRISGNGFLYHMIRIIVGTLLQVGTGKKKPEDIKDILEAKDRTKAGPTVPAKGLCLIELKY